VISRIGVVDRPRWGSWRGGMRGLTRCSTCRLMSTPPLELRSQLVCPFSVLHGKLLASAFFLRQRKLFLLIISRSFAVSPESREHGLDFSTPRKHLRFRFWY
jgi:hypothetical protein